MSRPFDSRSSRRAKASRARRGVGKRRARRMAPSETLEVQVDVLGAQGDGVARWAGQTLYIPGALASERVRVKTGAKRADGLVCTLLDVLEPSPERVAPICEHFMRCGGCALQHLNPDAYRAWKHARVSEVLAKRGLADVCVLDPILIGPGTRRRAAFQVHKHAGTLDLGYNVQASHDIVAMNACALLNTELDALIDPLRGVLSKVLANGERARVSLNGCDNGVDVFIEADSAPSLSAREAIAAFVAQGQAVRMAWREADFEPEPVAQTAQPVVDISGVCVELPIGAFLQASRGAEHAIRDAIVAGVQGADRIADLYCGLGSFTLPLAENAIVRAVDSVTDAVRALERAAGRAGLGGRVMAEVRDLERNPLEAKELTKFDAIVFDPPRAGARAQAARIAASGVERVVAVSCNLATFARDARILVDGGYRLIEVLPIDQFTYSAHVELVAQFARV